MDVDGVGRETPCLHLLSDLLGVGRGEHADFAGFFEIVWDMGEQGGDSIGKTDGSKNTGSKQGVAAKGVEESVFRAGNIGVNPGYVRQLFDCELTDGTLFAFANPLEGQVVTAGIKRKR